MLLLPWYECCACVAALCGNVGSGETELGEWLTECGSNVCSGAVVLDSKSVERGDELYEVGWKGEIGAVAPELVIEVGVELG